MANPPGRDDALNWRSEFRDPALEALFRRTLLAHDACQMRYALALAAALFLAFTLTDYRLLGFEEAFWGLLAMRITLALGCGMMVLALWWRPALAHRVVPINLMCLAGVGGILLTLVLRPEGTATHLASLVVASIALYLFVPNRLPWMLADNACLAMGLLGVTGIFTPLSTTLLATSLVLLAFVNLLGATTVLRLHRLQREQFAQLLEERDANRRLKAEIEERRLLEERLRHIAGTDELTGITNRRRFFELAEQELRRARRDATPLALCMVDIDLFKHLNDRHGHAVGDRVLTAVAACCQTVLRDSDIIGRYGGEEFVIALPLANLHTATRIAERLRQEVAGLSLPELGDASRLSVTVGISLVEAGESRLDGALMRADEALYQGKARGRNRVVVAGLHGPRLQAVQA
jgi:diguanylate cyclase